MSLACFFKVPENVFRKVDLVLQSRRLETRHVRWCEHRCLWQKKAEMDPFCRLPQSYERAKTEHKKWVSFKLATSDLHI